MTGLEWILKFAILPEIIMECQIYAELLNIWVFEPVFKYVWSKSSFFVHKASILIKYS